MMESIAWERLQKKFSGLLDPVDPRSPPKDAPEELKKWAMDVSTVVTMVMAYCGLTEYQKLRAEAIVVPKELPPAMHDMYLRNQQSGRTAKIASRALIGGWHALLFGGMFYGIDSLAAIARDAQDVPNTALAGLVTGSVYGALIPGNLAFRATRSLLGGAVGIGTGALVGYLSYSLPQSLGEQEKQKQGPSPPATPFSAQ
jgi:anti-sigma factor RsiW